MIVTGSFASELRFPPPDFESGYQMPATAYPAARAQGLEYLDAGILLGCLVLASWLVLRRRSRRGVVALSLFSLAYFGFYRQGCICAIGSVQNVALALGGNGYELPAVVGVFFALPLLTALLFGRSFCAAVCPHGALQDLVLVRPIRVPRWLEDGLAVLPFLYLGAGVIFAATGATFLICRFDPLVPIFRMSGSLAMVVTGGLLLAAGMFIGRPYCRFLCPYGALLRIASALSRWKVGITPGRCTKCQLCLGSCPFGVIREPDPGTVRPRDLAVARRRLVAALVAFPFVLATGAAVGWTFGRAAAGLHPSVALAESFARQAPGDASAHLTNPERLALARAAREAPELLPRALELERRFDRAGFWFGLWAGLVVGVRLISLGMIRKRNDFEPDRTGCFGCARCFLSCPEERLRLGLGVSPVSAAVGMAAPAACASADTTPCEAPR